MKKHIQLIISIVVTLAMLGFIFSTVSLSDSIDLISRIDKRLTLLFFLTSLMMSICSSWRYNLLLSAAGCRAPVFSMYLVVLVRNLGSDLLPARIGTLVYIWLCRSRLAIPLHAALSSFSVALLLDIMAICPLFLLAAIFATNLASVSPLTIILSACMLLSVIILAAFSGLKIFDFLYAKFSGRLKNSWLQTIHQARADLDNIKNPALLIKLITLSVLVRIFKYLGLYFFLLALLSPLGYGVAELPLPKMFLGMSLAELSSSLPVSGIAGLGTYQGAWIAAFSFLGFPLDLAKTTSLSHHIFTQLYGYGLGLFALLILSLPFFARTQPLDTKPQKYFYLKLLLFVAAYFSSAQLLMCYGSGNN